MSILSSKQKIDQLMTVSLMSLSFNLQGCAVAQLSENFNFFTRSLNWQEAELIWKREINLIKYLHFFENNASI